MTTSYIEKVIAERAKALGLDNFDDNTDLEDLAYDSLAIADLVVKISKHYKLNLLDIWPEKWTTVGQVKFHVLNAVKDRG